MEPRRMKIAQLSRESGLTRSTIHHYVNIGLLHKPRQEGLNLHLFDETHLDRLKKIRRLREDEGLSLPRIKELLDRTLPLGETEEAPETNGPVPTAKTRGASSPAAEQSRRNRDKILDVAIKLFSEKGYENTKISDITDSLHMGKGTFYVYFKNKKELFMECIDRLTVTIVPRESWDEIRNEQDYLQKTYKRGVVFLKAFPDFRGILNLLRAALGGNDPTLARKAKETFKILSAPMAKDLRRAIANGELRPDQDVELAAHLQLVIAEALGDWLMIEPGYSVEEGMRVLLDMFTHGFTQPGAEAWRPDAGSAEPGVVEDGKGVSTRLEGLSVDGRSGLSGKRGEADVDVAFSKMASVNMQKEGSGQVAKVTMKDGQSLEIEVDGERVLSGKAAFGSFRIPLNRVNRIMVEQT